MAKAKKLIDPKTGKATTFIALKRKLREEEGKLNTFRTVIGAFSQTVVIAAYKNALGMDPTPPNGSDTLYGMKPDWKTATFDNGHPVVQMYSKERTEWDEVYADSDVAFLQHDGSDLAAVNLTDQKYLPESKALTSKEWQHWVDLLGAAPKLLKLAKELRARSVILPGDLVVLLDQALEAAYENTKSKN